MDLFDFLIGPGYFIGFVGCFFLFRACGLPEGIACVFSLFVAVPLGWIINETLKWMLEGIWNWFSSTFSFVQMLLFLGATPIVFLRDAFKRLVVTFYVDDFAALGIALGHVTARRFELRAVVNRTFAASFTCVLCHDRLLLSTSPRIRPILAALLPFDDNCWRKGKTSAFGAVERQSATRRGIFGNGAAQSQIAVAAIVGNVTQ